MTIFELLILLVLVFVLLESPLFTVMGGAAVVCFYCVDYDWTSLQSILIEMNRLASFPVLVALPMFCLVGCLITETQAPRRIMNFLHALIGWFPGGLGIAALCASSFFTALTGGSAMTIVALGGILYPILRQKNYSENFTLGLATTSGSLGLLFPPSLPIILYGLVAQVSISDIFKAAVAPGILLLAILSIYSVVNQLLTSDSWRKGEKEGRISWQLLKTTFIASIWDWPIAIIIVVGVYGGIATMAEVSAVVLAYVIIVECFILKEIDIFKQLPSIMIDSSILAGAVIIIMALGFGMVGFLVDEQIPNKIFEIMTRLTQSKLMFLFGLNIFLLIVGCMMDIFSAIVIVVPIMIPVAAQYGIHPIHLCIIFLLNLEIGYSTPPVGLNLFIASLKFQKPITVLYRASFMWLMLMVVALLIVTYVPSLSLFLIE
jgi:C4-dicarboxylate transporter, DctM subunit